MIVMLQKSVKKKRYLPADPAHKGKPLYILYKFDISINETMSEGPFIDKDKVYKKMNSLLRKGVCSWVVIYNE